MIRLGTRSSIRFQWEEWNRPELETLKEKYLPSSLTKQSDDEFGQMLFLKDWVRQTLPLGYNPKRQYQSSLEILQDVNEGGEFYCSHYALVFLQCATALRWYTRKLGIDNDHKKGEEEMHHGIIDIWSNQHKKWLVVDPMHNLHFEKDDVPLNAIEIRSEFLQNYAKDVEGIIGNHKKRLKYGKNVQGFDQPSNYFWFFILLRNNFFEDPNMYNSKSLLWSDEFNKDKVWYKGGGKKGESHPHPMYENQFIKTDDPSLCFPNMSKK